MNDRELLERAARAIGGEAKLGLGSPNMRWWLTDASGALSPWDPLEDDGDALRLAVQLRISVIFRSVGCDATDGNIGMAYERFLECDTSATRRAIVRAAAEIGKAMS